MVDFSFSQVTTATWMQLIAADAFKPMVAPSLATTPTTLRPTTIGFQQKTVLTKQPPSLNLYIDSKDVPVAEALRREPISRYRNRSRRPFKRYHSQSYNRPRRRPKPVYGPPSYSFDPQPNDFQFEPDFFDATPTFTVKPTKKKPTNIVAFDAKDYGIPKDYGGIVDTDIGKFYDSSSATFHVGPFKSTYDSSGSAFFAGAGATGAGATASGSGVDDSADFDDPNNYKYIGSSSALGGESEFKFTAPSAAAAAAADDSDRFKFGSSFTSSGTGADASPDYKFTSFGSDAAAAPYPPSTSNFDPSKYNSYAPQQQVVYQTAPKTLQSNRGKLPAAPYPAAAKIPPRYNENVLSASYSFGGANQAANAYNQQTANNNFNTFETTFKQPKPPSTSYGVPIAPALNAFTYQSSNGNNANRYAPTGQSNVQPQNNNFVPVSSISLTKSQEVGASLPDGHFAEPPPLNEQELADVDDQLYRKPQSSYDATPKSRRSTTTAKPPPVRRPSKVNSKRVTTQAPQISQNSREEFEYDVVGGDDDDDASSYVVRSKQMPQPALPNSYDQEEFHTVTKGKRKPSRAPQKNFDDFESYFDQTEIGRKPKKPKAQRTPPPQQIDDVTDTNFDVPEEDYVDDLFRTQTPQTPAKKRPLQTSSKKRPPPASPSRPTTPHILDTDDLRAAFAADLANQQFSPLGNSKSRRNTNRNRYQQEQQQQDDDFYEDEVS